MHSNIRIIPSVDHFFIDRYGSRELWNMRFEIKKGLTHSAIKPFRYLVAGIGFEPMTFGL